MLPTDIYIYLHTGANPAKMVAKDHQHLKGYYGEEKRSEV
jgi:hypothetical protein